MCKYIPFLFEGSTKQNEQWLGQVKLYFRVTFAVRQLSLYNGLDFAAILCEGKQGRLPCSVFCSSQIWNGSMVNTKSLADAVDLLHILVFCYHEMVEEVSLMLQCIKNTLGIMWFRKKEMEH